MNNPYDAPNFSQQPGGTSKPVSDRAAAPAIALIVVGALITLEKLWGVGSWALRKTGAFAANQDQQIEQLREQLGDDHPMVEIMISMQEYADSPLTLILAIVGLICGILIIMGAIKMKKYRGYGLALTASILVMIPQSCCCFLGLPIGIWSIIVLMNPEVKAAFRANS